MHQVNPAYFMTILVPAAQTGKALRSAVMNLYQLFLMTRIYQNYFERLLYPFVFKLRAAKA